MPPAPDLNDASHAGLEVAGDIAVELEVPSAGELPDQLTLLAGANHDCVGVIVMMYFAFLHHFGHFRAMFGLRGDVADREVVVYPALVRDDETNGLVDPHRNGRRFEAHVGHRDIDYSVDFRGVARLSEGKPLVPGAMVHPRHVVHFVREGGPSGGDQQKRAGGGDRSKPQRLAGNSSLVHIYSFRC